MTMFWRRSLAPATVVLLAVSLVSPVGASELGNAGEIYTLRAGPANELFPQIVTTAGSNSILALDISTNGQLTRRPVPGTDGPEVEDQAQAVFDDAGGVLYLVWRETFGFSASLQVQAYRNGDFGALSEVSLAGIELLGEPHLAVTRSVFESEATSTSQALQRTVLHLLTIESDGPYEAVVYRAIVLVDGVIAASGETVVLNTLLLAAPSVAAELPDGAYQQVLTAPGVEEESLLVVFADRPTATLAAVQLRPLTGEVGLFADRARSVISGYDSKTTSPSPTTANAIFDELLSFGAVFHPGIAEYIASVVREDLTSALAEGTGLGGPADRARELIIESGLRSRPGGVLAPQLPLASGTVIEVPEASATEWIGTSLIEARSVGEWPLSGIAVWPAGIVPSATGAELLVHWRQTNEVRYRHATATGWTAVASIPVTQDLSAEEVEALLAARIRRHR